MTDAVSPSVYPPQILDRAIKALNAADAEFPLEDVDLALEITPQDFRLWHVKGLIHREQDQRELAIPALRRALELAPQAPLIAHAYARVLLEAGLNCVEPFARALKLAPKNPDVVKGLAAALVAEDRSDEAIEGIARVLGRSPLWTDGHVLLADLRWRQGEREHFTRSFDKALKLHPNSLDLRREQMTALLHAELFDQVLDRAEQGRRMLGQHLIFLAFEAAALSETGAIKAADALFEELALFGDANSTVRHIRHLLRSARAEEAIPILDRWIETEDRAMFWPSAATAWRLTCDPRVQWLEGDHRLVGVYDIEDQLPSLDRIVKILRGLHELHGQPLSQSVRGGTQTDGNLFHRIEPEIVAVRETLRNTIAQHVVNLPELDARHPLSLTRPARIVFSGAWSVRLFAGGRHTNHVHPNGWLSSALYIDLPDGLGGDEKAGWLALGEPDKRLELDLPPHRMIEPKAGRLALFPSWMWHGTRSFGSGERITVAFDVAGGR